MDGWKKSHLENNGITMAPTSGKKRKANQSDKAGGSKTGKCRKKASVETNSRFEPGESWNVKEKERLLSGLKIFAPTSLHSLARYVQTKTPEEVEAKIASIRQVCTLADPLTRVRRDAANEKKAPLEAWLPVGRALVKDEPTDLSEKLSAIMCIIGRTGVSTESLSLKLNWQNIYEYISDLLADRLHLRALTDVESLVILDVMHGMADTLRNSDTAEQRRLMKLKYKYFMSDPLCFPQFANRDEMVAMALRNDFSSVENEATMSSGLSCPTTLPSLSAEDVHENDSSGTAASSSFSTSFDTPSYVDTHGVAGTPSSLAPQETKKASETNASSSSSSSAPQETKTASEANVTSSSSSLAPQETKTASEAKASPSSSSSSSTAHLTNASVAPINNDDGAKNDVATGDGSVSFEDDDKAQQTASKVSLSDMAWTPESGYCRPRYYTINPFCIPLHLLDFKEKKT